MKWTEQEVEFLRENYYKKSLKELSQVLGRTPQAISRKAWYEGIGSPEPNANKEKSKAYAEVYRRTHREELNAYMRAYRKANIDKFRGRGRAYYHEHREPILSRNKAYAKAHKAERSAYNRDYYKANKEKLKEQRIKQYRKENSKKMTICWECRLALQDPKEPIKCEWACKRQPVKGWQADEAQINMGNKTVVGYRVRSCPKFTAI